MVDTPLRQRKKDATRRAIGQAAHQLFAEKGYDGTSVTEIAERADVAPRTFFRYFPSKEAVIYPDLDDDMAEARRAFLARPSDEPVLSGLVLAFEPFAASLAADTPQNRARLRVLRETRDESLGGYVRSRLTEQVELMVAERDGGRPDAALRARLAGGVVGLVVEVCREHWLATGDAASFDDYAARCTTVLRELLAEAPRPG